MGPEFQAPPDGSEAYVEGNPVRVAPDCTVKDVWRGWLNRSRNGVGRAVLGGE